MICIDTHLHFYDFYDARLFLKSLISGLDSLSSGCRKGGVILDREGQRGFELLRERAHKLSDFDVKDGRDCFEYKFGDESCKVYRGIQVACAERFEMLGLFCSSEFEDGINASEAIERILEAGGIPVLAWAPGKWMFARKPLVESILHDADLRGLYVGDTSLRPACWATPQLMRMFRERGGKVLCGSDPLPFAGQERVAGTYSSKLSPEKVTDVREAVEKCLKEGSVGLGCAGRRAGLLSFIFRMIKGKLAK